MHPSPKRLALAALLLFGPGCGRAHKPPPDDMAAMRRHLDAAQQSIQSNDLNAAEREAKAAEKAAPGSPEPILLRAQILARASRLTEQRDILIQAHNRWPDDSRITRQALHVDTLMIRPGETEKLAREAIAGSPNTWDGHYYLGLAILSTEDKNRLKEAIQEFQRAFELNPAENANLIEMGHALSLQGDDTQAAAMLELASRNLDAMKGKGRVGMGQLDRWILQRRTAAFRLAEVYRRLNRKKEAQVQSRLAAQASASYAELRRLMRLGTMNPPDMVARAKVEALCAKGVGLFTAP